MHRFSQHLGSPLLTVLAARVYHSDISFSEVKGSGSCLPHVALGVPASE
jgi:hypothetical protein